MAMDFGMMEKRGERRIRTEYQLSFQLAEHQKQISGRTVDLSYSGLCFFTGDKLPVAAQARFTLDPGEGRELLFFDGRLVHISEAGEDGYFVGIQFVELSAETHERLQNLIKSIDIIKLLSSMMEKETSDLHLAVDRPPLFRIQRELFPQGTEALSPDRVRRLIYSVMSVAQITEFEKTKEMNFALTVPDVGRWRVNVHYQQGFVEANYRAISLQSRSLDQLGLPPVVADLARSPDGLVIVAGPTGVGKSTTLAAMVDLINTEKRNVIVTLEDPIEYLHQGKRSVVKQREVGSDTLSFAAGLKNLLRQDPDVIFIGEILDRQTLAVALTAAETGHLVLTSLHTSDAMQTIHRILGLFPPDQRQEAAVQLAAGLRGIICQRLFQRLDNQGLVVATEVLVGNPAVRAVVRDMKINQIPTLIQTGASVGMHSLAAAIKQLAKRRIISADVAMALVGGSDPEEFAGAEAGRFAVTGQIPTVG